MSSKVAVEVNGMQFKDLTYLTTCVLLGDDKKYSVF